MSCYPFADFSVLEPILKMPRSPIGSSSVYASNLPDLSRLRAELALEPVNTGRVIRPMGPSGIVTDDIEGLHARTDKYGKVRFASGVEFPPYAYRDHGFQRLLGALLGMEAHRFQRRLGMTGKDVEGLEIALREAK